MTYENIQNMRIAANKHYKNNQEKTDEIFTKILNRIDEFKA